ncbi:MAG: TonB-dependent receptor [Verrucomicrobiales bacterium]|nr:TonB-dependent receptor [Verrucomicrobiales bacterium]
MLGTVVFGVLLSPRDGGAAGLFREGAGSRSMSLAGASVATPERGLEAMTVNPAGLVMLPSARAEFSVVGGFVEADYDKAGAGARSMEDAGVVGDAAFAMPLGNGKWAAGLSIASMAALSADWTYPDALGGLGGATTYGMRRHFSELLLLRSALGVAWRFDEDWSVGVSGGHLYNRNALEAPYTFQSEPVLKGFKTLLDLDAEGHGWNAQVGLHGRICENLQIGLSYTSPSKIHAQGTADGNAAEQLTALGGAFAGVRPDFSYDADVTTRFPQIVSAGLAWQPRANWRISLQGDWIDWSAAFDELRIDLTRGNNTDLNSFLGRDHATDVAPLDWNDQWVARLGVEWMPSDAWTMRAGYAYAQSAVPSSTLTPLTAAIFEHTVAAGVGYQRRAWSVDLAWQWNLPSRQDLTSERILSGEYADASVEVQAHWIGLTFGIGF